MDSKPPLRERSWYAPVWGVSLVGSGIWTLFNAYIGFQLLVHPTHNMEAGFEAVGWEIFLVISIPIYCLFVGLFFLFPKVVREDTKPSIEQQSSKDW